MWESRTSVTGNGVSIAAGRRSISPTVRGQWCEISKPCVNRRDLQRPWSGRVPCDFHRAAFPHPYRDELHERSDLVP
jgi:hypothetical protein